MDHDSKIVFKFSFLIILYVDFGFLDIFRKMRWNKHSNPMVLLFTILLLPSFNHQVVLEPLFLLIDFREVSIEVLVVVYF